MSAMMAALYVSMNAVVVEGVALRTGPRLEGIPMSVQSFVRASGLGRRRRAPSAVARPRRGRAGRRRYGDRARLQRRRRSSSAAFDLLRRYDIDRAAHEANLAEPERAASGCGECKLSSAAEGASPAVLPRGMPGGADN